MLRPSLPGASPDGPFARSNDVPADPALAASISAFAQAAAPLGQTAAAFTGLAPPVSDFSKGLATQTQAMGLATRGLTDLLRVEQQLARVERDRSRVRPTTPAAPRLSPLSESARQSLSAMRPAEAQLRAQLTALASSSARSSLGPGALAGILAGQAVLGQSALHGVARQALAGAAGAAPAGPGAGRMLAGPAPAAPGAGQPGTGAPAAPGRPDRERLQRQAVRDYGEEFRGTRGTRQQLQGQTSALEAAMEGGVESNTNAANALRGRFMASRDLRMKRSLEMLYGSQLERHNLGSTAEAGKYRSGFATGMDARGERSFLQAQQLRERRKLLGGPEHLHMLLGQAERDRERRLNAARTDTYTADAGRADLGTPGGRAAHEETLRQGFRGQASRAGLAGDQARIAQGLIGGHEHRQAVGEQLRTGMVEEGNQLRNNIVLARERSKYLASPEGVRASREQVRLGKELATAQRGVAWKQSVADLGLVGAWSAKIRTDLAGWTANARTFSGVAGSAFSALSAGVLGAVAAASPSHFATLTGSFQLLSAKIGQTFLPLIDEASLKLQKLARWFGGLSADTKESIAWWTKWGLILSGGAYVATKAILGLAAAGQALKIGLAFLASPYTIGFAAVTVAVGAMTNAFGLLGTETSRAREQMESIVRVRQRLTGGLVEREDWRSVLQPSQRREYIDVMGQDKGKQMTFLEKVKGEADRTLSGRFIPLLEKRIMEADEVLAKIGDTKKASLWSATEQQERAVAAKQAVEAFAASSSFPEIKALGRGGFDMTRSRAAIEQHRAELVQMVETPQARRLWAESQIKTGGLQGPQKQGPDELLRAFRGPVQASFSSFAEYADKLQVAALRDGDLDAENRREQLQALKDSKVLLESLDENIAEMRRLMPAPTFRD